MYVQKKGSKDKASIIHFDISPFIFSLRLINLYIIIFLDFKMTSGIGATIFIFGGG